MLGRHVERFEVVVVVFELGPFDDQKPEAREDRFDALAKDGQGMTVADRRYAARQRDVDGSGRRARGARRGQALGQPGFDLDFQVVGELTEARPIGRQAPGRAP